MHSEFSTQIGCASARGRVSKTPPTRGGTEAACQLYTSIFEPRFHSCFGFRPSFGFRVSDFYMGVVADKKCTCPASKLMRERYPPTPPFHCGENEIQASLISSASVGATPTPATNLGRCSGCRSVKPVSQTTVGSDDWSITSTSHHFRIRSSISGATRCLREG